MSTTDGRWLTPAEYMARLEADPVYTSFMTDVMRILTTLETRRTVQVATRKYKARRKRR